MLQKETGFTLLETLITLSILSTLLLLPIITLPKKIQTDQQKAMYVAEQLKEDLLLAQHVAMSAGRQTAVRFNNQKREYVIRFSVQDIYLMRPYVNEEMYVEFTTINATSISFLPNGHPSHSGSFILQVDEKRYLFTIYLGKGMVAYTEL